MTIVFGIDPGSVYTGFGVIKKVGQSFEHVDSGRIVAGKAGVDFSARLDRIYNDLTKLLHQHQPDYTHKYPVHIFRDHSDTRPLPVQHIRQE